MRVWKEMIECTVDGLQRWRCKCKMGNTQLVKQAKTCNRRQRNEPAESTVIYPSFVNPWVLFWAFYYGKVSAWIGQLKLKTNRDQLRLDAMCSMLEVKVRSSCNAWRPRTFISSQTVLQPKVTYMYANVKKAFQQLENQQRLHSFATSNPFAALKFNLNTSDNEKNGISGSHTTTITISC